jgi:hypothetical protein
MGIYGPMMASLTFVYTRITYRLQVPRVLISYKRTFGTPLTTTSFAYNWYFYDLFLTTDNIIMVILLFLMLSGVYILLLLFSWASDANTRSNNLEKKRTRFASGCETRSVLFGRVPIYLYIFMGKNTYIMHI